MTEIERIKQEGWLPESFWKAETICDFEVTEERKKLWAILLDLFKEVLRVCEKYNLQYWADGGTMLGAVRHKGFIPWDDDMDVIMPRKDYDKLIALAEEFKFPYFLDYPTTDVEYGYSYIKFRNSNTTQVHGKFNYTNFNHGICIDIFPLDKISEENIFTRKNRIKELIMCNSCRMRLPNPNLDDGDKVTMNKYFHPELSNIDILNKVNEIATLDKEKDVDFFSNMVVTVYPHEKTLWPKSIYKNTVKMPFECFEINIPSGHDTYLNILYGNYMELPPLEKRGNWHLAECITDVPYKQYYKEKLGIELK